VGRVKDNWILWNTDMRKRRETQRRLVTEFDSVFVWLQKVFDDADQLASAGYWIWDGIHPTYSGHELITREWLKQVRKKLPFLKDIHF
jgi:lysophospholipase L1-like esterase